MQNNSPASPHRNNHILARTPPLPLPLHRGGKGNRTHDAIAKDLIHDRLVGIAIDHHDLVEAVDQRLGGGHRHQSAAVRVVEEEVLELRGGEGERVGEDGDVGGGDGGLAVEERGDGYFVAVEEGGEGAEG